MNDGLVLMMLELPLTMRKKTRRWFLILFPITIPIWAFMILVVTIIEAVIAIAAFAHSFWTKEDLAE